MKTKLRFFALFVSLILLICLASVFTGCGDTQKNEDVKLLTEKFLNAVIENDADAAYSVMTPEVNRAEFDAFFVQLQEMFNGVSSYELKQTGWNSSFNNGITSYKVTFTMKANNGSEFQVESTVVNGYENLYYVHFTPVKNADSPLPILFPFQMGAFVLSAITIAFSVWMIVDCARRKISKKVLWIILILVGVSITLSFGEGFSLNWLIGLAIGGSSVSSGGGLVSFKLMIPVGAIIYFIMRKKLKSVSVPTAEAAVEVINVDPTESESIEASDSAETPAEDNAGNAPSDAKDE